MRREQQNVVERQSWLGPDAAVAAREPFVVLNRQRPAAGANRYSGPEILRGVYRHGLMYHTRPIVRKRRRTRRGKKKAAAARTRSRFRSARSAGSPIQCSSMISWPA